MHMEKKNFEITISFNTNILKIQKIILAIKSA